VSRPVEGIRGHFRWLAAYWRPHWPFGLFLLSLTVVSATVATAYPLVMRTVTDQYFTRLLEGDADLVLRNRMLAILGVIAFGRLVAGFYPAFRAWMNLKLEKAVREKVFGSILAKDYTFFGKFRTGDLVTRLTDDITEYPRISWFGCSGIFRFIDSASVVLLCVAGMLTCDVRLALLSLTPVPLMLLVFYKAKNALRDTYEKQQEAVSRTNNMIEAAFSGIRIVKAFNSDAGQKQRLDSILRERIGIQLTLAKLIALVHQMDDLASRVGQVVVITVGGIGVVNGDLTIGTLLAIYLYLEILIHPMMDLPNLFVTARQAFVSIDREEEILKYPVVVGRDGTDAETDGIERVAFEGVGFAYRDDAPRALDAISFEVPRGSTVAVVGPVASGKSTLLKVLAGLLPAQQGAYRLNGRAFEEWNWARLRRRFGYVPQESLLFSETIEENVAFDRAGDDGWIERCLEVAQMGPDLETMSDGLQTRLGTAGTLVSGGQKQRIAIARALAGRPDLLLLDDCTASLDARNEDRFWSDLQRDFPEATVFVVSHRIATILRAETILVLDEGRLIDRGNHAELSERCAVYQEFLQTEQRREHLGY
jgi:ATP-binding cassette subfamily B protein